MYGGARGVDGRGPGGASEARAREHLRPGTTRAVPATRRPRDPPPPEFAMRLAPATLALALLTLPHLPALAHPACADSPLHLNEVMAGPARDWDGSGLFSSRDDEWVEVVNVGLETLDLVGWLLTDGDV